MWDYQRQWWDLPNFIRLMVTGYGGGKTVTLMKWSIAMALHNAPVPFGIVSPTFPMARKTVVPTLTRLLAGKETVRQDMKWSHNQSAHEFKINVECRPPATLIYMSGDNPIALKGSNLCGAAIDEPFIQDYEVMLQMLARVRDPDAKMLALGLGGTPEQLNWGYDLAEGELKSQFDVGYVTADTRQNLAISPEYAARLLKGFDEKAAAAYVGGKFVNMSKGRVFYAFDRERHVAETKTETATMFVGMDFNVDPMAFVVGYHVGNRAHIIAEHELPNSDTQYACGIIRDKYPTVKIVFPDPSGKHRSTNAPGGMSDFTWIRNAGYVVLAPNNGWPLRDSYNSVNNMFSKGLLTIAPSCKRLIRYLSEYSHENKTKQKSMSHLLDAMRYPITYLFPAYQKSTTSTRMVGA